MKFKITGFHENDDCIAILENGKEIRVDPFVGCAFEYEKKEHLLGEWWEADGAWYTRGPKTFLLSEGTLKQIKT